MTGGAAVGEQFRAEFDDDGFGEFAVREAVADRLAVWECVANDAQEWVGTTIRFEVEADGERSILRFAHEGWREASDFYASCNFFWGRLMVRLGRMAETGKPQIAA